MNTLITPRKETLLGHEYYAPHRRVFLIENTDELTGRPLKAYAIETRSGALLFVKTAKIIPVKGVK